MYSCIFTIKTSLAVYSKHWAETHNINQGTKTILTPILISNLGGLTCQSHYLKKCNDKTFLYSHNFFSFVFLIKNKKIKTFKFWVKLVIGLALQ